MPVSQWLQYPKYGNYECCHEPEDQVERHPDPDEVGKAIAASVIYERIGLIRASPRLGDEHVDRRVAEQVSRDAADKGMS